MKIGEANAALMSATASVVLSVSALRINYRWGEPSGLDVNVVPTTLPSSSDVEVIVGVPSMRVVDCTLSTGLSVDV